jgi:hypothetical protein
MRNQSVGFYLSINIIHLTPCPKIDEISGKDYINFYSIWSNEKRKFKKEDPIMRK